MIAPTFGMLLLDGAHAPAQVIDSSIRANSPRRRAVSSLAGSAFSTAPGVASFLGNGASSAVDFVAMFSAAFLPFSFATTHAAAGMIR
jgi:hypothetical protein